MGGPSGASPGWFVTLPVLKVALPSGAEMLHRLDPITVRGSRYAAEIDPDKQTFSTQMESMVGVQRNHTRNETPAIFVITIIIISRVLPALWDLPAWPGTFQVVLFPHR